MHLKSISVKGFKSFPDRTRLEFGPGVSVIVGPNGSGKSNITDAVLWALGEQSPLAVRGQSMQDVIFAGGAGVKSRNAAEVEIVIDNSDQRLHTDFSEVSITRRLDRSGDGVYRMNGARCRLVDVLEVLSDSGLGKEMHSVISQGRVEAIIHSKPFDRTALIEEAAGLSKHRKRRHRAQLKLGRTQDNLDRALDVEREARSRLRPLKRQAEAAELHARLERQSLELREQLTADSLCVVRAELVDAERTSAAARDRRDSLERRQSEVAQRREQAERALAEHGKDRELLGSRLYAARSASERISIRLESVRGLSQSLRARLERARRALDDPEGAAAIDPQARIAELEEELGRIERERNAKLAGELEGIASERGAAGAHANELAERIEAKTAELEEAERATERERERGRAAAALAQQAVRRHAELELELERLRRRLRPAEGAGGRSLADRVRVEEGFEGALSAALGGRQHATVVGDIRTGAEEIGRAGADGARAIVKGRGLPGRPPASPVRGAVRLLDRVTSEPEVRELVERLLADAWVVEAIEEVPNDFEGIAVTRSGTAYRGSLRELRSSAGDTRSVFAERARLDEAESELRSAATELLEAKGEAEDAERSSGEGELRREAIAVELRDLRRAREEAVEQERRAGWLIDRRRELADSPADGRRNELVAEIGAERRLVEELARERELRTARRRRLEAGVERDRVLLPAAERLVGALEAALRSVEQLHESLDRELMADEAVGQEQAAELRQLAQSEYDLQARLREAAEELTQDEVRVAQIRDREQTTAADLAGISSRLGSEPALEPLADEERREVEARLERLERRRERIGPVNPLAEHEYKEAIEHVEELEAQRNDLEAALAELEGLIRETDRRIRESFEETFAAAASNFEDVIQQLFPGGHGRLRLVKPPRPRAVIGGAEPDEQSPAVIDDAADAEEPGFASLGGGSGEDAASEAVALEGEETLGVEIEVTPAGKSTKRLSLLSGGEKSLVALGFLFAVFLARPCPFYILDEVEAALDDLNIDRFLGIVRRYAERSQFIVITHQRRTMEAADVLYGVSMGKDGISKVVSRKLEREPAGPEGSAEPEQLTEAA
jgi:chromosome segregation protein